MATSNSRGSSGTRSSNSSCPCDSNLVNVGDSERLVSVIAGAALACFGLARRRWAGLLTAGIGAGMIYRGVTGNCQVFRLLGIDSTGWDRAGGPPGVPAQTGVKVERTMVIRRPVAGIFGFWQKLDRLPTVFQHLKSVVVDDKGLSHWVARGPFDTDISWDAVVINQKTNELIAWRSLPHGDIETAGSIHFRPLDNQRGTAVTISMKYNPPAGIVGNAVASWFGTDLERILADDLERFRIVMESEQRELATYSA